MIRKIDISRRYSRELYSQLRSFAAQSPGEFHGEIAKQEIFWFDQRQEAWIKWDAPSAKWVGLANDLVNPK